MEGAQGCVNNSYLMKFDECARVLRVPSLAVLLNKRVEISSSLGHYAEGPRGIRLEDDESGSARNKIERRETQNPGPQLDTKDLLIFGSFRIAAFQEITSPCYVQSSHE